MAKEKTEKKITEEKISKQETKIEDKPKTTPLKTKPVAKETPELERIYIIPLREKCRSVPRYKKTNKAVKTIKEFIARHMRVQNRDLEKIKIQDSKIRKKRKNCRSKTKNKINKKRNFRRKH